MNINEYLKDPKCVAMYGDDFREKITNAPGMEFFPVKIRSEIVDLIRQGIELASKKGRVSLYTLLVLNYTGPENACLGYGKPAPTKPDPLKAWRSTEALFDKQERMKQEQYDNIQAMFDSATLFAIIKAPKHTYVVPIL